LNMLTISSKCVLKQAAARVGGGYAEVLEQVCLPSGLGDELV